MNLVCDEIIDNIDPAFLEDKGIEEGDVAKWEEECQKQRGLEKEQEEFQRNRIPENEFIDLDGQFKSK